MKIKNKFDAPFGPSPSLRLMYVSRWGIISMDRKQSVAEHSFNVAVIVEYICTELNLNEYTRMSMVVRALGHDGEEVYTGDIPTPAKQKEIEAYTSPFDDPLLKLADVIEAWRYAYVHCNDTANVKNWLLKKLWVYMVDITEQSEQLTWDLIEPLLKDVK